jgi:hypothetical protein
MAACPPNVFSYAGLRALLDYSHRRWMQSRRQFLHELAAERVGLLRSTRASRRERAANDRNLAGDAAPETVFLSVAEVRRRLKRFSAVRVVKVNVDESDHPRWDRKAVLPTWGRRMGLDLYISARK